MSTGLWAVWAVVLLFQNWSFTFVSRARNSGSLSRHLKAALASNGVWFASQLIMFSAMLDLITGKRGIGMAVLTGVFYTVFTLIGSLTGHYVAMRTEKGKSAVGASAKYAQVTNEDYEMLKMLIKLHQPYSGEQELELAQTNYLVV